MTIAVISVDEATFERLVGDKLSKSAAFDAQVQERVVRFKQHGATQIAQAYYQGMLQAVSEVLESPGVDSILTEGVKSRRVKVPLSAALPPGARAFNKAFRLTSGRLSPQPWAPLTFGYAKRRPISETFWRKRRRPGDLHSLFVADSRGRTAVGSSASYSGRTQKLKALGPGRYQGGFRLTFPALHPAVGPLLGTPFVHGEIEAISGKGSSRTTLEVIRYPEFYRPWLSRLAKIAGAQMRQTIAAL